jgi:hypothetical protein
MAARLPVCLPCHCVAPVWHQPVERGLTLIVPSGRLAVAYEGAYCLVVV